MSAGLLFLDSDDFFKAEGQKGPIICHKIKGLCLVLYYSTECNNCRKFIPEFKKLPGRIGGCQFGMVNINNNVKLIKLTHNTIAPIHFVPYIMLYVDGKPFIRYDGEHDINMITDFIIDVNTKLKQREQFLYQQKKLKMNSMNMNMEQQQKKDFHLEEVNGIKLRVDTKDRIPAYTVGVPKKDDELFYFEYNEAYKNFERRQ